MRLPWKRSPDFIIGSPDRPYLLRWWLIPRNRFFNVYLHKIMRDDDDRALHDHPWANLSIILSGGYLEWRSHAWDKYMDVVWRGRGSIVFRRATDAHRLSLGADGTPCWSLFITGPRVREWGFWCPQGWRVWHEFVDAKDSGQVGRGCE
jgi:hypothetical protein